MLLEVLVEKSLSFVNFYRHFQYFYNFVLCRHSLPAFFELFKKTPTHFKEIFVKTKNEIRLAEDSLKYVTAQEDLTFKHQFLKGIVHQFRIYIIFLVHKKRFG